MKITSNHLEKLKAAIVPLDTDAHRTQYAQAGLSDMRYRWDLLHAAKMMDFVCKDLYQYLNDTHIDSALRSIVKPLSK